MYGTHAYNPITQELEADRPERYSRPVSAKEGLSFGSRPTRIDLRPSLKQQNIQADLELIYNQIILTNYKDYMSLLQLFPFSITLLFDTVSFFPFCQII